jgi:putative endonuclease
MPPLRPYQINTMTLWLSTIALCPQTVPGRASGVGTVAVMTTQRRAVGAYGERLAERHLCEQGLVVLARNWRCAGGEVDLILRDGADVVFCEVKTRRGDRFGTPAEAISPAKVRRLRRLAARWLEQTTVRPREVRFDVVAVLPQPRGATLIEHIRAAF